ncbi:WbqC family protein [Lysinibacillus sp. NPDC056959]|uniref:WbqC family protein n=1 Tax=Lysinibacillus sp. NPDC056959 TaxID=3345981 RepID=UPI00362AB38B
MKIAIMQPTYLPWAGYFKMIMDVDKFIFLDDVQFAKRSWQQRNKIILNGKEKLLTVPVLNSGKQFQKIKDVSINTDDDWVKSHIMTIEQSYRKHPYFREFYPIVKSTFEKSVDNLCDININFIKDTLNYLEIETEIIRSRDLDIYGKKSQYLYDICKYFGATTYLSADGSKNYLEEEQIFSENNIDVEYLNFKMLKYPQLNTTDFVSYLSIIDVIFNLGKNETITYLRNN